MNSAALTMLISKEVLAALVVLDSVRVLAAPVVLDLVLDSVKVLAALVVLLRFLLRFSSNDSSQFIFLVQSAM